jgi:hypothetical protein
MLKPNPLIGLIEGAVGDLVFAHTKDGRIRVQHRPVRKAPFRAGELKRQASVAAANRYVTRVRQSPEEYAVYQNAARITGKRACDLARCDCLCAPTIKDIDVSQYTGTPGQIVLVEATDDFEVLSVGIVISDAAGLVLEQGPAALDQTLGRWVYKVSVAVATGQTVVIHVRTSRGVSPGEYEISAMISGSPGLTPPSDV